VEVKSSQEDPDSMYILHVKKHHYSQLTPGQRGCHHGISRSETD
jgi:hypothetical protein